MSAVEARDAQGNRIHVAARVEDRLLAGVNRILRRFFDWQPRIEPFTGLGSPREVRVLARVLLSPEHLGRRRHPQRRGFRSYLAIPAPFQRVTVTIGATSVDAVSDRAGYVDIVVPITPGKELKPGWRRVVIDPDEPGVPTKKARARIVGDEVRLGVISDIDDTAMVTMVPDLLMAAWNTFLAETSSRRPVHGMAELYRDLATAHPAAPFVYLSNGAWNTARMLRRFLARNGYPPGPLLLTDFGPTHTGWFRSGVEHKTSSITRLAEMFPNIKWVLVGDDGQKDPEIYLTAAQRLPGHIAAIAIRTLSRGQRMITPGARLRPMQVPSHGPTRIRQVPLVVGPDGVGIGLGLSDFGLLPKADYQRD